MDCHPQSPRVWRGSSNQYLSAVVVALLIRASFEAQKKDGDRAHYRSTVQHNEVRRTKDRLFAIAARARTTASAGQISPTGSLLRQSREAFARVAHTGNAGANTTADQIAVEDQALAQTLPNVEASSFWWVPTPAGATHELAAGLVMIAHDLLS